MGVNSSHSAAQWSDGAVDAGKVRSLPSTATASRPATVKKRVITKLRAKNGKILERGPELIGQKLKVMWGSTWYKGEIVEYKPDEVYKWQIHYEDDDREFGTFSDDYRFHHTARAKRPVEWLSCTPLLLEEEYVEAEEISKTDHAVLISNINGKDIDRDDLVGNDVRILWTNQKWYQAKIEDYMPWKPQFKWFLHYEDDDTEWGDWSEDYALFNSERGAARTVEWLTAKREVKEGPPPPRVSNSMLAKALPQVAKQFDDATALIEANSKVVITNKENSQMLAEYAKKISLFVQYKACDKIDKIQNEPQAMLAAFNSISRLLDRFSRQKWLANLEFANSDKAHFEGSSRFLMQTCQVWLDVVGVQLGDAIGSMPSFKDESSEIRKTVCELGGSDVCVDAIKALRDQERLQELSTVLAIDATAIDASVKAMQLGAARALTQQAEAEGMVTLPRMPLALKQFWLGCFNKQSVVWSVFYRNLVTALGDQVDVYMDHLKQYSSSEKSFENVILRGLDINKRDNEVTVEEFHLFYEVCAALSDVPVTNLERCCSTLVEKIGQNLLARDFPSLMHIAAATGSPKVIDVLLNHEGDIEVTEDGATPLHVAAANGQLECVRLLLQRGADLEARNEDGWTPLMYACASQLPSTLDAVKLMVAAGADLEAQNEVGMTPLIAAAEKGNKEVAELLISKKVNIDITNKDGYSALLSAAGNGRTEVVDLLLSKGAKLTAKDKDGWNALHFAANGGHIAIVKALLEKGFDADAKAADGRTPLHLAAKCSNTEVLNLLLTKGAKINTTSSNGYTPLIFAIEGSMVENAKILISKGADMKVQDKDGWSPLHFAANNSSEELIRLLLDKGADIDAQTTDGRTALYLAAVRTADTCVKLLLERKAKVDLAATDTGMTPLLAVMNSWWPNNDLVKLIIDGGANVNIAKKDGTTPLMLACENGLTEIVDMLLAKGADIKAKNEDGRTAMTKAMSSEATLGKLLDKGGDINARASDDDTLIMRTVWNDWEALFKRVLAAGAALDLKNEYGHHILTFVGYHGRGENYLKPILEKGLDVDFPWTGPDRIISHEKGMWTDCFGSTGMHTAIEKNKNDTAKLFIQNGAKVEATQEHGYTAMHLAAMHDNNEGILLLLDKGAKVNAVSNDGLTPLHMAAQKGHVLPVSTLVEKGARVDVADKDGKTPLHMAADKGELKVIEVLLAKGANVAAVTKEGDTPLHLAAAAGHLSPVELLLAKGAAINAVNKASKTPLMLAKENSKEEVVKLLTK